MVSTNSIRKIFVFKIMLFAFILCSSGLATTYYVKPDGNDALSGTSLVNAWQHLMRACTILVAGDTVFIRSGTYNERYGSNCPPGNMDCGFHFKNNGTPGNYIVAKGYPGDPLPVIVGNPGNAYACNLTGNSWIILDGLCFKYGYRGITMVTGSDIVIRYCVVCSTGQNLQNSNNNGGFCSLFNGFGAVRKITVEHCEFFENMDEDGGGSNCSGIHIYNCDSCEFAYNTIHDQNDGIYIKGCIPGGQPDSTKWIDIHDNVIYDCGGWGVHVMGQGYIRQVKVHHNAIYNSHGIMFGYGDPTYHLDASLAYNNTIDGGYIRCGWTSKYYTTSCSTFNNIYFNCAHSGPPDYCSEHGTQSSAHVNYYEDYDCVYNSSSQAMFIWGGNAWSLQQWRNNTDDGDHTIESTPLFVDPTNHDYRLQAGSPCATGGRGGNYPSYMGAYPSFSTDSIPPVISNVQSSGITDNSATISWDTDEPATSQVEYGLSISYGFSTTLDPNLVTTHSQNLTELSSNTLYHYRVRSNDVAGNERISSDYTFTTADQDTIPPVISNVQSSGIIHNSATISWDTDEPATSQVEYGLDIYYGNITTEDPSLVTSHSQVLTELDADTTYHYRVISRDGQGNEALSSDHTFTTTGNSANLALGITASVDGTYPGYTINPITDGVIDPYGGTTTWASDESSTLPHWIVIDFGENHRVGNVTIFWAWNNYQSQWMTPREYHIQRWDGSDYLDAATLTDPPIGNVTVTTFPEVTTSRIRVYQPANMGPEFYPEVIWLTELEIYGFSDTVDTIPPMIFDVGTTDITRHEATISWNTDEIATSLVEYGFTPSYGSSTNLDTNLVTNHSQHLTGLYPDTVYHYRVRSRDGGDNEAISQDYIFRTARRPTKPRPLNPPDDSTLGEPNPDLVILNGIDSLGFELLHLFQIDTAMNFDSPDMQESSPFGLEYVDDSTTLWTVPQELSIGTYCWRAYAYTNTFPSDTSDPSEVFSFSITYTDAMDTVYQLNLEYPLQNDTVPTIRPTLVARLVSGSSEMNLLSCQFEVSESPLFLNNVLSSERITFSEDRTARWEVTQDLKQNTRFHWRAKLYSQDRLLDITQTSTIFTETIHVFPNPFKPSLGHSHVTFRNIPLNSTIIVTTISGDLVKTFDGNQQTDVVWDVRSEDQKELASGVYLYQVSHSGKVSSGKILVIR